MLASSPRAKVSSRLASAAVALGFIAAQLSSVAHNTLVEHELCEEHGTLEHPDVRASVAEPQAKHQHSSIENSPAGELPAHEHSSCILYSHEDDEPIAHIVALAKSDYARPTIQRANIRLGPKTKGLFYLAPKASPPA